MTAAEAVEAASGTAATAPAAAPEGKAAAPPSASAVVDLSAPGSFCSELWQSVEDIFSAILVHPFLTGLVDGSLPEDCFRYYVVQSVLYLREYARALALLASKAPLPAHTTFWAKCAHDTFLEEATFHKEFLDYFGTSVQAEVAANVASPTCQLYSSSILQAVHERAFYEGLAAVLPCFVVYLEVGKALKARGSTHRLYQKFIDRFGGAEYEGLVAAVVRMADEAAAPLGQAQRERMQALFQRGCRMEWMFWEAAYTRQQWPV